MDIDRTNKRILALLRKDGRMSAAAIGRAIGLSRPAVQERISLMERSGHILGYHAEVAETLGLVSAVLFVQIAERPCEKALQWLMTLAGVTSAISLAGEIDAIVFATMPTMADLSALNDQVLASPLILSAKSTVILRQY
jgi:Lrp/AsnC family leucine-responsive transcriptional regulator